MNVLLRNLKPESSDTREETVQDSMFSRKLQAWFSYFTAGSDGVEVGQTTYRSLHFSIRTRYRTVTTVLYRASDVFSGPSPLLRP